MEDFRRMDHSTGTPPALWKGHQLHPLMFAKQGQKTL